MIYDQTKVFRNKKIINSMERIALLVVFILFAMSCNQDGINFTKLPPSDQSKDLLIKPQKLLNEGRQIMFQNDQDNVYRAYPASSYIEVVSLATGEVDTLTIPKDGPYTIGRLNGFVVSKQHYFLFGNGKLLKMTKNGEVVLAKNYAGGNFKNNALSNYLVRVNHEFPPKMWEDQIIVHVEKSDSDKQSYPYHYDGLVFAAIETDSLVVKPLEISWPVSNGYYGSAHKVHFSVTGNLLIYGSFYSPEVYAYNKETNLTDRFNLTDFQGVENYVYTGSNDATDMIAHLYKTSLYGQLTEGIDGVYYQLVYTPPPSSDVRYGKGHLLGLRILSSDFSNMIEDVLSPGTLPEWIVNVNGYYLRRYSEKEDVLDYRFVQ